MPKFWMSGVAIAAVVIAHAVDAPAPTLRLADPAIGDQDDMCVWVHPTDARMSVVITSDKKANKLFIYDLNGKTIQTLEVERPGNIDSRPGFPFARGSVDIVVVNLRAEKVLAVFKVDPESRTLGRIDDGSIGTGESYGGCLYKSKRTGRMFAVVTSGTGLVTEYELLDDGALRVKGKAVRVWNVGHVCEGAVADDDTGRVYVSEERAGVWEFGGEPEDDSPGSLVIKVGENKLRGDVEGLAIFRRAGGAGYLLVSDQGRSKFQVYRREGGHEFVGEFTVAGAGKTDGIEVIPVSLGPKYPNGLFLCHTGTATPCPILLTPWDEIARTFTPPLATCRGTFD